jgi:hypothetical protein
MKTEGRTVEKEIYGIKHQKEEPSENQGSPPQPLFDFIVIK